MTRKKISTSANNAAIVELEDDQELVETVTTTKRIGREKRRTEESEPGAVATGFTPPDDDDDENIIDAEIEDDDDPGYSETSIAARLFGYRKDGRENYSSHLCTAIIRREPDDIRDSFLTPCSRQTYIGKLPAISITTNEEDLADRIREMNGGGNYTVQYHYNGKIQSEALAITIADDPRKVAAASSAAAPTQPAATTLPPPVSDPFDAMLAQVDKLAKLKEVFGGGNDIEKVKLEFQIAELRREIEAAKAAPQERKSERLTLFEAAIAAGANNPLQSKILDNLFPAEEKGERHWFADTLDVALQHKDEIIAIAGPLLASFLGGGRPAMPPPMMPQAPPPAFVPPPPPKPSGLFASAPPPDAVGEMPENGVVTGIKFGDQETAVDPPVPFKKGDQVVVSRSGVEVIEPEPVPPGQSPDADEEPDNTNAIDAEENE